MSQDVSPLRTGLLLCVFLSLIGAYIYAGIKTTELPYPATISANQDQLIIPFARQQVLLFNAYGDLTGSMKFADTQYDNAFVSAAQINEHEFIMYASRRGEQQKDLYRCDTDIKNCHIFSDKLPRLTLGSTLLWDSEYQRLYVAASSEHAVFKLNEQGEVIARYAADLRYPNGLSLHDNELWLVSSGNQQLVGFERNADSDLREIKRFTLQTDSSCGRRPGIFSIFQTEPFCEPVYVLAMQDSFWLLIKSEDLSRGRIDEYDREGNLRGSKTLYPDANPAGLTLWRDDILVSDYSAKTIMRMDMGGQWRLFDNDALRIQREAVLIEQQKYTRLKNIALWIFVPLFFIALAVGIFQEYKRKKEETAVNPQQTFNALPEVVPDAESRAGEYWLKPSLSKKMLDRLLLMTPILLGVCILLVMALTLTSEKPMWGLSLGVLVMSVLLGRLMFVLRRTANARVGVKGRMMFFRDHSGAVELLPVEEVRITKGKLIYANGRFYNFGRDFVFIAKGDVNAHLLPRISRMQVMEEFESLRLIWAKASMLDRALLVGALLLSIIAYVAN